MKEHPGVQHVDCTLESDDPEDWLWSVAVARTAGVASAFAICEALSRSGRLAYL